jgi:hypothetical protein
VRCGHCRTPFYEFQRPRLKVGRLRTSRAVVCKTCSRTWTPGEFDADARRRLRLAAKERRQHTLATSPNHVYVVSLQPDDSGGEHFYVGQSSKTPEARFQQHLEGVKSARVVRTRGQALVPSLYEEWNPLLRFESHFLEAAIFDALHAIHGDRVRGGT